MNRKPIEGRAIVNNNSKVCVNCFIIKEKMEKNINIHSSTISAKSVAKVIERNGVFRSKIINLEDTGKKTLTTYSSPKIDFIKKLNVSELDSSRWCPECGSMVDQRFYLQQSSNTIDFYMTFLKNEALPAKIKIKLPNNVKIENSAKTLFVYNLYQQQQAITISEMTINNYGNIQLSNNGNVFSLNIDNPIVFLNNNITLRISFDSTSIVGLDDSNIDEYDVFQIETYDYLSEKYVVTGQYIGYMLLTKYSMLEDRNNDFDETFFKPLVSPIVNTKILRTAFAWGKDNWGQLGSGDSKQKSSPTKILFEDPIIISNKLNFTLSVNSQGELFASGYNKEGQLLFSDDKLIHTKPKKRDLSNYIGGTIFDVQAGWYHAILLDSENQVWSWGNNNRSQLGNGSNGLFSSEPLKVQSTEGDLSNIKNISTYSDFSLALDNDGFIWKFGGSKSNTEDEYAYQTKTYDEDIGEEADFGEVEQISTGEYHSLALKSNKIWSLGYNFSGQLGVGSSVDRENYQSDDNEEYVRWIPIDSVNIDSASYFSCGSQHSVAIDTSGMVWTWGNNSFGQIGNGKINNNISLYDQYSPYLISRSVPYIFYTKVLSNKRWQIKIPELLDINTYDIEVYVEGMVQKSNVAKYEITISPNIEEKTIDSLIRSSTSSDLSLSVILDKKNPQYTSKQQPTISGYTVGAVEGDTVVLSFIVNEFSNVEKLFVGSNTNIAIKEDKTVWCWGDNGANQFLLKEKNILYPTKVKDFEGIENFTIGNDAIFYIKEEVVESKEATIPTYNSPPQPTNLFAENISENGFKLIWSQPTYTNPISNYEIYKNNILLGNSPISEFFIAGLELNQLYDFNVIAIDSRNQRSEPSDNFVFKTRKPINNFKPINITYSSLVSSEVGLSWETTDIDANDIQYEVYMDGNFLKTSNQKSIFVDNLEEFSTYEFKIRAFNLDGDYSDFSSEISITTKDLIPPTIPKNIQLISLNSNSATFFWTESIDDIGVKQYSVYINDALSKITNINNVTISGLSPLTTYSLKIKAVDVANNQSQFSEELFFTTKDPSGPSVPENLEGVDIEPYSFWLIWTHSSDNIGVKEYEVYKNGALYTTSLVDEVEITGLSPLTTYQMSIRATDEDGNKSNYSPTISVTTSSI